jgi:hypothetical protein
LGSVSPGSKKNKEYSMTKTYFPFDNAGSYEAQWTKMFSAIPSGVVGGIANGLQVYGDSTGMQVKVKSGRAFIKGHTFDSDALETLAIAASDPTLGRWDLVCVKLDWVNNIIDLVVKTGTPAASPALPGLTQTSTIWEIPLGRVVVDATVSTIAANKVSDRRVFNNLFTIDIVVGDGSAVVPTGVHRDLPLRYTDFIIAGWEIIPDISGSIQFDLWVKDSSAPPPTVTDTIITTVKPILTATVIANSGELEMAGISTWAGAVQNCSLVLNGRILRVNVDSAATVKRVTLTLFCFKKN